MSRIRSAWPAAASLIVLAGCTAGLSSSLKHRVAEEHAALLAAAKTLQRAGITVKHNVASDPSLFGATSQPAKWSAHLDDAHRKLATAQESDRELAMLVGRNRADLKSEIERLLLKENTLRQAALQETQTTLDDSSKWIHFRDNLHANLEHTNADHAALENDNSSDLTSIVQKAEQDWPAKKTLLEDRLQNLHTIRQGAESVWTDSTQARDDAAHDAIAGPELASLIEASDALSSDRTNLGKQSEALRASVTQLYDSWDKILIDLDAKGDDYRERIRTVRTHFIDVAAKQSETSSNEQWVDVSPADYRSVENDLGMAIAHKDAGQFDSDVVGTPEPAGFAYIAPEAEGSNQYGYWNHDGGHSVWTWLPQYLILRELLWNHAYRPVVIEDYRGYQTAQHSGQTYYGRTTPSAPTPEYGTRGSFTRTTYANSRYVQSGSFKQSAYSSHPTASAHSTFGGSHAQAQDHSAFSGGSAGKRFGTGAAPSSGRRFGHSSPGRSFGRSFGRHR